MRLKWSMREGGIQILSEFKDVFTQWEQFRFTEHLLWVRQYSEALALSSSQLCGLATHTLGHFRDENNRGRDGLTRCPSPTCGETGFKPGSSDSRANACIYAALDYTVSLSFEHSNSYYTNTFITKASLLLSKILARPFFEWLQWSINLTKN